MACYEIKIWEFVCDGCEIAAEVSRGDPTLRGRHVITRQHADNQLRREGWSIQPDDRHFCPKCREGNQQPPSDL